MIVLARNGAGDWCVGRQEGQHNLGICTAQGKADWLWVTGAKPVSIDDIAIIRAGSMAGYVQETTLRRLLTVRNDWSKK